MASPSSMIHRLLLALSVVSAAVLVSGHLSPAFYSATCPNLRSIVRSAMAEAVRQNPRNAAFVLRLFFHDCFVNGCDASILLDGTAAFASEKFANANNNSAHGFELIDAIKASVEAECPATVSCADVLALAAHDGVASLGGPTWTVQLGRRDSLAAYQDAANEEIPAPFDDLSRLISLFRDKGLSPRDMTALSGAHTIGLAQCSSFAAHIYNDCNADPSFAASRRRICSPDGGTNLAPLDSETPSRFDNAYYRGLVARRGLLHSDQELLNGGSQDALVRQYSDDGAAFAGDFAAAMVKMGALSPRPGTTGEVRLKCNKLN
ncbi:peroxidase P7-like [Curcuma longa]|uniref:peroxidase P7-like n=1 Tax=Curcuma longa TaxID=136217 RepID=UPI003D9F115F